LGGKTSCVLEEEENGGCGEVLTKGNTAEAKKTGNAQKKKKDQRSTPDPEVDGNNDTLTGGKQPPGRNTQNEEKKSNPLSAPRMPEKTNWRQILDALKQN